MGGSVGALLGIPDYQAEADKKMAETNRLAEEERKKLQAQQAATMKKQQAEEISASVQKQKALVAGLAGGFSPQNIQVPTKNILGG